MWRLAVMLLAACTHAAPIAPSPTMVPPLRVDAIFVEPAPACPAPEPAVIDAETRRKIMNDANEHWNNTQDGYFRDYSAITAKLPPLGAKWHQRASVPYRGVVITHLIAQDDGAPLVDGHGGRVQRFELLPHSELPVKGTFEPLWSDPKTWRSLGPIHAAIAVRPRRTALHRERQQVVIYTPRDRPDILLVATKPWVTLEWTPFLRIDLPEATRFSVYPVPESH